MSTASKNFDPGQMINDLVGFIRDRGSAAMTSGIRNKPSAKQTESAVLNALSSSSKNAAEIGRSIALASGGVWNPSAGEVQTTLKSLTEAGQVTSKTKGDRKIFTITELGLETLNSAEVLDGSTESGAGQSKAKNLMTCDPGYLVSVTKLGPVLLDVAQTGTSEQQARAAAILENARHQLHVILAEG